MITKNRRLAVVSELVKTHAPESQDAILRLLRDKGFVSSQTTLSRDIKQLRIFKVANEKGHYTYMVPDQEYFLANDLFSNEKTATSQNHGLRSIDFCDKIAVIKINTGFAREIASDIERRASSVILSTFSSDDAILLILREGVKRNEVLQLLSKIFPSANNLFKEKGQ